MKIEFSNLRGEDIFLSLMGKNIANANPEDMLNMWTITCSHISTMYQTAVLDRKMKE